MTEDGWFVIAGELRDGRQVDVYHDKIGPVDFNKPGLVSSEYKTQRWRKYMLNLRTRDFTNHRLHYGRFLCRNWNSKEIGANSLDNFKIIYIEEKTLKTGIAKPRRQTLWQHYCFKLPSKIVEKHSDPDVKSAH